MSKFQALSIVFILMLLSACQPNVPEVIDPLPGQWMQIPTSGLIEIRSMGFVPKQNTILIGAMPGPDTASLNLLDTTTNQLTPVPTITGGIIPSFLVDDETIYAVQFSNPVQPGAIWTSQDSGATWLAEPALPESADPRCLAFAGEDRSVLLLGTVNQGILYSEDRGATWLIPEKAPEDVRIQALAVNPENPMHILAGLSIGMTESLDGGKTWSTVSSRIQEAPYFVVTVDAHPRNNGEFTAIYRTPDGKAEVVLSSDAGQTWQPIRQGFFDDSQPRCIEFHHSRNDVMYCGTVHDGIYYTADKGLNWQPINKELPLKEKPIIFHCLQMVPGPEDILYAGSSIDGKVFSRVFK